MFDPAAPTILFVREVPWQTVYPVSTRILAEHFARDGWNVIWLSSPLMLWHLGRAQAHPDRRAMLAQLRQGGIGYGRVLAYTPLAPLPFSRRFPLDRPLLARLVWRACAPAIRATLRRHGAPEPDLLWIAEYSAGGLRDLFPQRPLIFHVTDAYRYYRSAPATCVQLERANYQAADQIVVTAPALKTLIMNDFAVAAERISVMMHGVDSERFVGVERQPDPLAGRARPRLVAVGNTAKLDFAILERLAACPASGTVVVVGPRNQRLEALARRLPKLHLTGALPPEAVPAYLANADVGLILFGKHMQGVAQYVCPMKLFEYAMAGLPTISTPLPIYADLDVAVLIAATPDDALAGLWHALTAHEQLRREMLAFAAHNTWQQRYLEARTLAYRLLAGQRAVQPAHASVG